MDLIGLFNYYGLLMEKVGVVEGMYIVLKNLYENSPRGKEKFYAAQIRATKLDKRAEDALDKLHLFEAVLKEYVHS